jgi:hypothetical protein
MEIEKVYRRARCQIALEDEKPSKIQKGIELQVRGAPRSKRAMFGNYIFGRMASKPC